MSARQRAPPTASKPENAAATTTKPASEQNTNIGAAGPISPEPARATPAAPASGKPDSAPARETLRVGARVLAAYWNEKREFEGFWLATVKRIEPASTPSSGSTPRNIRRSRAGPRTSPFRIPSSASRASDARKSVLRETPMGRPSGRPSSFRACPEPGARHPTPNLKRPSHDQHNRVHRRTHPRPQRRLPPHLRRRRRHDHRRRRSHAGSINVARSSRRSAPSTPSPTTTIPTANTTSARSTRAASAASGRSTTTTARPSWARPIPLIPPSPRAS